MRVATLNLVTQRKEKCSQTRSMAVKIEKAVKPHQIKRSTKTVTVLITVFALILSLLSISTLSNDNSGLTHGAPHFLDVKLSPSNLQLSTGQTGTFIANVTGYDGNYHCTWSTNGTEPYPYITTQFGDHGEYLNFTFTDDNPNTYSLQCEAVDDLEGHGTSYPDALIFNTNNSNNTTIDTSDNTPPVNSYLVESDGLGWYRAVDGATGQVAQYSTNASYVTNSIIGGFDKDTGGTIIYRKGTLTLDAPIVITANHVKLFGEQRGAVILDWAGAEGESVITTSDSPYIYDLTIEDLSFQTHNKANAIHLKPCLRYTIRDVNIAGGDSSNQYDGIILDGSYGNNGWGVIDNVFMDYVFHAVNMFGSDVSHVVTDINIGTIFATHVLSSGLRFTQFTDTIDVQYAFFSAGKDNAVGAIFNDGQNPDFDNAVYNIQINRLIFDNWHYSNAFTVYVNNVKELKINSAFKGNSTDVFGYFNPNAVSYSIVEQGEDGNNMKTYSLNAGSDSGRSYVSDGDWIRHYTGYTPTSITVTPEGSYLVWVTARNETHFQVGICWPNGTAVEGATVNWATTYKP